MIIEALVAPAKLTLSLRVVGIRDDGYHLVDAEMVTLDLADELEVSPPAGAEGQLTIEDRTGGLSVVVQPMQRQCCGGQGSLTWWPLRESALTCRSAWWAGERGCPGLGR